MNINTAYDFYVQADCGNGQTSNWITPIHLSQIMEPINSCLDYDFGLSGNSGKALLLTANQSISDLSQIWFCY